MEQIFWTVLSGVSVFVLGQIVQNFVLKPLQDYFSVIGEISYKIKLYSNILVNSLFKEEDVEKACREMRDLSCRLESKYVLIRAIDILVLFGIVSDVKNVNAASASLIQLANAAGTKGEEDNNLVAIEKIKKGLNIFINPS